LGEDLHALTEELNALLEAPMVAMTPSGESAHDSHGAAILLLYLLCLFIML
jgi:hypothetical protein